MQISEFELQRQREEWDAHMREFSYTPCPSCGRQSMTHMDALMERSCEWCREEFEKPC